MLNLWRWPPLKSATDRMRPNFYGISKTVFIYTWPTLFNLGVYRVLSPPIWISCYSSEHILTFLLWPHRKVTKFLVPACTNENFSTHLSLVLSLNEEHARQSTTTYSCIMCTPETVAWFADDSYHCQWYTNVQCVPK
jgi:hypothetical protein